MPAELVSYSTKLNNYSNSDPYKPDYDGIVVAQAINGATATIYASGNLIVDVKGNSSDRWDRSSCFVKGGTSLYGLVSSTSNSYAVYYRYKAY